MLSFLPDLLPQNLQKKIDGTEAFCYNDKLKRYVILGGTEYENEKNAESGAADGAVCRSADRRTCCLKG